MLNDAAIRLRNLVGDAEDKQSLRHAIVAAKKLLDEERAAKEDLAKVSIAFVANG